jgi:agmatine deiminase
VIVPTFNDSHYDHKTLDQLQALFPERTVVGVYSHEIVLGGRNIHRITQQQPVQRL